VVRPADRSPWPVYTRHPEMQTLMIQEDPRKRSGLAWRKPIGDGKVP
jgi:hypothetical protein